MSLQNAIQQRRADPEPFDWKEYCEGHDYSLASILSDSRNRTRRRIDVTNWVCGIIVAVLLAAALIESM